MSLFETAQTIHTLTCVPKLCWLLQLAAMLAVRLAINLNYGHNLVNRIRDLCRCVAWTVILLFVCIVPASRFLHSTGYGLAMLLVTTTILIVAVSRR